MTQIYAPVLILIFLAITFIQSGYDKAFHWNDNLAWLTGHFQKSILRNNVAAAMAILLAFELISGIMALVGCCQLFINGERTFGFYGAVFSSVTFLMLLFGQRIAKDYDGARTIAIYFIPAIMAVYWLG